MVKIYTAIFDVPCAGIKNDELFFKVIFRHTLVGQAHHEISMLW
jgi:hypothetical protein